MATRSICPRAAGEGSLGTSAKPWGNIVCNSISIVEGGGIVAESVAAANITGGLIGTGHLGTGTANSTTYLRGDGSWTTVTATNQATTMDAGDITGGVIATAHLGSGSPDNTKWLRGDGAWVTLTPEASTFLTLQNSFVNWGTGNNASVYKDPMGLVHMEGCVQGPGGTTQSTVMMNLPVGYRPTRNQYLSVASNLATIGYIVIHINGDVMYWSGDPQFMALDGVTFRVDR